MTEVRAHRLSRYSVPESTSHTDHHGGPDSPAPNCRSTSRCKTGRVAEPFGVAAQSSARLSVKMLLSVGHVGEDDAGLNITRMSDYLAACIDDRFASDLRITVHHLGLASRPRIKT